MNQPGGRETFLLYFKSQVAERGPRCLFTRVPPNPLRVRISSSFFYIVLFLFPFFFLSVPCDTHSVAQGIILQLLSCQELGG
jgi:hypothetical protein